MLTRYSYSDLAVFHLWYLLILSDLWEAIRDEILIGICEMIGLGRDKDDVVIRC